MKKIMIAGYGSAGQYLLDFILKDHRINNVSQIKIISRKDSSEVKPRIDISRVAAGLSQRFIPVIYESVDFSCPQELTRTIQSYDPDVIVYTGRFAAHLKYGAFSYPNQLGYGIWIPLAFPYIYNIMRAVKSSGCKAKVINTSFPDGTNLLLRSIDPSLTPYTGAGNINHLIPRIKVAASRLFRVDPRELEINFVCSHFSNTYISKEGTDKGSPTLLTIKNKETDEVYYDETIGTPEVKKTIFSLCKDVSAGGPIRNQMIATDCTEIVRLLTNDDTEGELIHVPGFKGNPGGFRVVVHNNEFIKSTDDNWSWSSINSTNMIGLQMDGIQEITEEGVVRFTPEVRERFKKVFNFVYPSQLSATELVPFADQLRKVLEDASLLSNWYDEVIR